ncbi:hypothetical protein AB0P36_32240 [Streptomyces flavidovirens]|uniref:hypothetical protein n=1 Tax=Streptomyces flavidovirens TaxID=67298 RepID=UPI00343C7220
MSGVILPPRTAAVGSNDDGARLHRLVRHLVADGDRRAAGHRARRTLDEMTPGDTRPPLLTLAQPLKAGNDACPLCGFWRCRCGGSVAPAATGASGMAVAR